MIDFCEQSGNLGGGRGGYGGRSGFDQVFETCFILMRDIEEEGLVHYLNISSCLVIMDRGNVPSLQKACSRGPFQSPLN